MHLCLHTCTASSIISSPHQNDTFVTIEYTLTRNYHSKFLVYVRVHSGCSQCIFETQVISFHNPPNDFISQLKVHFWLACTVSHSLILHDCLIWGTSFAFSYIVIVSATFGHLLVFFIAFSFLCS